jgi:hypothetical protein
MSRRFHLVAAAVVAAAIAVPIAQANTNAAPLSGARQGMLKVDPLAVSLVQRPGVSQASMVGVCALRVKVTGCFRPQRKRGVSAAAPAVSSPIPPAGFLEAIRMMAAAQRTGPIEPATAVVAS